jgi:hypothetical protein
MSSYLYRRRTEGNVGATEDWMQQFVPDAEKKVQEERVQHRKFEDQAVQKEQWREINLSILESARERLAEAITRTIAALKVADYPGVETVYEFSSFLPGWRGWFLDDSKKFFLLVNGDMASRPSSERYRKRFRHSPEKFAEAVTYTKYTEYAHSDDRHGVEHDMLLSPPAGFQAWTDRKVADTTKTLVTLLARYGLRP